MMTIYAPVIVYEWLKDDRHIIGNGFMPVFYNLNDLKLSYPDYPYQTIHLGASQVLTKDSLPPFENGFSLN